MPKSNQEYSARRFQEFQPPQSPRYDAGYDCELPADARSELRPKRPVILEPPRVERSVKPDRSGALMWAGTVALVAIILAGVIGYYSEGLKQPATPKQSAPVAQPTPVPAQPVSQPPMPPPPAVLAPRARLVLYKRWAGNGVYELIDSTGRTVKILGDPAPRAQLMSLPQDLSPLVPGRRYLATMPYNVEVLATYRGRLDAEWMLPQSGNQLGDMWLVGNVPWVWIWAPGAARADWIDP